MNDFFLPYLRDTMLTVPVLEQLQAGKSHDN
jgi:hypothetical protein